MHSPFASVDLFPEVEPHCGNTDENQRFTTDEADAWLRSVAGVEAWDLDPAACEESHRAPKWYGLPLDGRTLPWFGSVFCNPPWDDMESWVVAALASFEWHRGPNVVGFLRPGNRTHRPWWQKYVEPRRDGPLFRLLGADGPLISLRCRFAPKRFAYGGPGNPRGIGVAEPNFTSVGLIFKRDGEPVPPRKRRKLLIVNLPETP